MEPKGQNISVLATIDSFLHFVVKKLQENFKVVAVVLALVFLSGFGFQGYQHYQKSKEAKAQKTLFEAQSFHTEYLKKIEPKTNPDAKTKGEAKLEVKKDFAESISKYKNVIEKHPQSIAAIMAGLRISEFLIEDQKMTEASEQLKAIVENSNLKSSLAYQLAKYKWASSLEAISKCQEAIPVLESFQDGKSHFKNQAQLKMALCYEQLGDIEKAKGIYKKVMLENTNSGKQAEKYLKLLEFNNKG